MVEALLLVLRIRVALWVHPFKRFQATYVTRGERSGGKGDRCVDDSAAKDVGVAVRRSSRLVPGATCLPQAPATRVMLARRGVPNALLFGVARAENGGLQEHAWIEVGSSSWPATCETWPTTNAARPPRPRRLRSLAGRS